MSEVKTMLAIQKAVYVTVFFDVQRFCYLGIAFDPIVKAIAVNTPCCFVFGAVL